MPRKRADNKQPARIPRFVVPEGATQEEIYALARKEFTAADLAKYADLDEPMVPAEQVLTYLEAIHEEESRKRNRKRKKA
jgi:hypothetical protein